MAAIIVSACIATTICAQRWEAKPCDCRFGFLARGVCFPVSPQRAVAPVMTIAGVGTRSATLNYEHGPVAVMLDLMNPVSAFGRLVGQAWSCGGIKPSRETRGAPAICRAALAA